MHTSRQRLNRVDSRSYQSVPEKRDIYNSVAEMLFFPLGLLFLFAGVGTIEQGCMFLGLTTTLIGLLLVAISAKMYDESRENR